MYDVDFDHQFIETESMMITYIQEVLGIIAWRGGY